MNPTPVRRFLLINPNTNELTTERLRSVLLPRLPQDALLAVRTAAFGAPYIACEASHAVAAHACLDAWAEHLAGAPEPLEGVLIGCFGDPGLFALREVSACRVTGLAEASFIQAAARGPFAIVTGGERWPPMLMRLAQALGYDRLLRHIATVAPSGAELQADPELAMRCLGAACRQAASTGVQSIILGGAGLAGYAAGLQARCPVPLIDSASAGLDVLLGHLAPAATQSANRFHTPWTRMPPAFDGLAGVPQALDRL